MKRKKNYLNNKDMLKEIHLSKTSYCSFRDKKIDSQYDLIVETTDQIFGTERVEIGKTPKGKPIYGDVRVVDLARKAKADRLSKLGTPTTPNEIPLNDLVFRVMTEEHIPLVPKKKSKAAQVKDKKKAKTKDIFDELLEDEDTDEVLDPNDPDVELVPMRVNFPPFFHYRINTDHITDEDLINILKSGRLPLEIVGKSHWKGGIEGGHFSKNHGKTTDNLALMWMKLCERYATRSNWRGYTYNDEMQGQALVQLTQIGLRFNELKSQNPFAYYTAVVTNSFTRVLNIEKRMQEIRDDILEANGLTPSWTRQLENENTNNEGVGRD